MSAAMKQIFGEYPNGRLNADDAGAVAVSISNEGGVVRMEFPKPVAWIGFTGEQAMEIAQTLIKHARKAGVKSPLVLRIGE
jgi:hypothetical protein